MKDLQVLEEEKNSSHGVEDEEEESKAATAVATVPSSHAISSSPHVTTCNESQTSAVATAAVPPPHVISSPPVTRDASQTSREHQGQSQSKGKSNRLTQGLSLKKLKFVSMMTHKVTKDKKSPRTSPPPPANEGKVATCSVVNSRQEKEKTKEPTANKEDVSVAAAMNVGVDPVVNNSLASN